MKNTKNTRNKTPFAIIFIRIAALIILSVAVSVLYGWQTNNSGLKSIYPALSPMNPMAVVSFMIIGVSLYSITLQKISRSARIILSVALTAVGLISLSMVVYYATGFDTQLDRLLYESELSVNRMAPTTAVCFIAISISLILLLLRSNRKKLLKMLASVTLFISMVTLISYAYGVQPVYKQALTNPMAIHTAVLFLIVSIALYLSFKQRIRIYVSRSVLLLFVAAIGLFLLLSTLSYRNFTNNARAADNVEALYKSKVVLSELKINLLDAQRGQRGYLLTGKASYLDPYNDSRQLVEAHLSDVSELPATIVSPDEKLRLQILTNSLLLELAETISQYQDGNIPAAIDEVNSGTGKRFMDQLLAILDQSDRRTDMQLQASSDELAKQNQKTLTTLAFSSALILVLLFVSLLLFQENLKRDQKKVNDAEDGKNSAMDYSDKLQLEVTKRTLDLETAKLGLEQDVADRTAELHAELATTRGMNKHMVDRELKMVELKAEIAKLKDKS